MMDTLSTFSTNPFKKDEMLLWSKRNWESEQTTTRKHVQMPLEMKNVGRLSPCRSNKLGSTFSRRNE